MARNQTRHGFALVELGAVVVVAAVVVALSLAARGDGRRHARLADDMAKLKRIGQTTGAYGADNADLFWHFSWTAGDCPSEYADLRSASDDIEASACQAVDIMRRRGERPDMPRISSWIPNVSFSHLVLADYNGTVVPDFGMISSEDKVLLTWAADPKGFDEQKYCPPCPGGMGTGPAKRYPYMSSFEVPPAFWSSPASGADAFRQGSVHNQYVLPRDVDVGGHRLSEVAHPSEKAMVYERYARHFGPRAAFYAYPEARAVVLSADGRVDVRLTGDGNRGWQPSRPTSPDPEFFEYRPAAWEPAALSGGAADVVAGYYRWTRGAWLGRDFGGPEVGP